MITNRSIGRYGRFANGMFQIAAIIGIARKSGQPFGFEPWFNYDHKERFGSTEDIDLQKYFVNPLPELDPYLFYNQRYVNWGYEDLYLPVGNWDLQGHFQSEKWFKHCIDEVRYYFRMKDEYEQNDYVAIHYRAGDYQNGENSYHPRISREYLHKAMDLFPDSTFMLFSDSISELIPIINEYSWTNHKIWLDQGYINDFKKMKSCKSFICANSSYSLMAAILGEHPDKKIVCPKMWFGTAANGLPTQDLYPEGAIVI